MTDFTDLLDLAAERLGGAVLTVSDEFFALFLDGSQWSYAETLAHLKAHGVACLERPDNPTPWAQIYVTDPDGHVIELNAPR